MWHFWHVPAEECALSSVRTPGRSCWRHATPCCSVSSLVFHQHAECYPVCRGYKVHSPFNSDSPFLFYCISRVFPKMPLPPLAGSLAYGAQVGLRSTLDAWHSAKQPYYVSLGEFPGVSNGVTSVSEGPSTSLEKLISSGTPGFSFSTSKASPSPFQAPLPSESADAPLLPLCCTASHPYRPLCSSEFSLLRASPPAVGDIVHANEEVLLVAGLPRSFPFGGGNQPVPTSEEPQSRLPHPGAPLWLLCCPRRTEVRQFAQRLHSSRTSGHHAFPTGSSGSSSTSALPACTLFGAPDEEDIGVVCARGVCPDGSVKSLLARVDRRCRWRLLRAAPGASAQSRLGSEGVPAQESAHAGTRSALSVLHLDEDVLLQNCHTGQFLSLRMSDSGDTPGSARLVAVGKPVFAPAGVDLDAEKARPVSGVRGPSSAARLPQLSSSSLRGSVLRTAKPLLGLDPPPLMHSGWRIVPAGVRVAPSWDRVVPHSLLGPSEIDDSLLRRERFLGVPLSSLIANASDPVATPRLSLSPYADEGVFGVSEHARDGEGSSSCPSSEFRLGAGRGQALTSPVSVIGTPRASGATGRSSVAESWRSVGPESIGENDWVMRRLHADWPALTREVKERFLLEDLLFCLSGLDGTLIRILAVAPACANAEPDSPPSQPPSPSPDPPLPSFHFWLHPMLLGKAAAEPAPDVDSCTSVTSLIPGSTAPSFAAEPRASRLSERSEFAFQVSQAASEDAALCQMLPPLLPAACSLRLLLVFLELAGRRNSTSKAVAGISASSSASDVSAGLSGWGGEVAEAFCAAIKKIVEELGIRVGAWEGEVRRGRLTLQGLRAQLGPVTRALGVAEAVVREAWGRRGGDLLDAAEEVKKRLPCNDANQEICRFIFEKAAAPLARIVENWVHHGVLKDTYGEFFIREDPTVVAEGEPSLEWRGASFCVSASGGSQIDPSRGTDVRPCAVDWCRRRFVLVDRLVPNFLKPHARDIHRAGLYVYVLNSCSYAGLPPPSFSLPPEVRASTSASSLPPRLLPLLPSACARASAHLMHFFFHSLQLPRTLEMLHVFFLVGRGDFLQQFFEFAAPNDSTPGAAPGLSAGTGHDTLQEIAGLEGCMEQAIRSVSGFETLKEKISFFMHPVPSLCEAAQLLAHAHEEDNLRNLLGLSKLSRAVGDERGTNAGFGAVPTRRPSPSEWCRRVCLRYRCGWPLSLLYTSKALCSYELVFRFLLHIHLAQRQLNQLWMHIHETRSLFSFADMPVHLRHTVAIGEDMRIFTRNLLFYATTDVIALHYSALRRHLEALSPAALSPASSFASSSGLSAAPSGAPVCAFEDVQELHARFLSCLLRDLFLEDLGLLQTISKCLTICLVFSRHVKKFSFDAPDFPLLAAGALLGTSSLAPKGDTAEAERRTLGAEAAGRDLHTSAAQEAKAHANERSSRERIREARRQQIRAAVDSSGFGGMVRSAGASFRENFADFISKLEAFSNRFPASPSAHLLFRFNFNDRLSARSVPPAASAVSQPQIRQHASPGDESPSSHPSKSDCLTGDSAAAPVSSRSHESKSGASSPGPLPPSRALASHAREKRYGEEGFEEHHSISDREEGERSPKQVPTPKNHAAAETSRRIGSFERPPPFSAAIPASLRHSSVCSASTSRLASESERDRGVSVSPFPVVSACLDGERRGGNNEGESRRRAGVEEEKSSSGFTERWAGGHRGLLGDRGAERSPAHASDEFTDEDAEETYSLVSGEDGEGDEDFDAALRSFQERIRSSRGSECRDKKALTSSPSREEDAEFEVRGGLESDAEDFRDIGDIEGSEERSSFGDDAGSRVPRRRDSENFSEFFDEDGDEELLDAEEDLEPRTGERRSGEVLPAEGYAAAFLRSRAGCGR
ncbi:Spc97 / Spc98 family protein [Toxoplasma gondii RUB]|uniref:Spc97 / Spc98 family protein n=1 Tax=Toxoplasma gondii RUB TaxID=935652 RepID=A0A086M9P1_TOXGO|nr:Spc97 / Spc98 family protein [Toxoplasma gondii RUB]